MLFDLAKIDKFNKPLTPKILSNPKHKITKHLLYLYSMESFIYSDMNEACRKKDKSKIQYYGAYAAALSYIIYYANQNRKDDRLAGSTKLYRGLKMTNLEISTYKKGETCPLLGYTSTSKQFEFAKKFAFMEMVDGTTPVVLEIDFKGKRGLFEMSDEFTAYPGEEEVLIQDGLKYEIIDNYEETDE